MPFLEPFIAIPYLAAKTEKLRFTTSVIKLAIRQPVIVAKQLSSLSIYPNPTSDLLHIEIPDTKALEGYRYRNTTKNTRCGGYLPI